MSIRGVPIRVALLDDHRVVTRSLRAYFDLFGDLDVVGACATGEELLANLAEWRPRVAVVDLLLPGGIDGIETTRRIRAQRTDTQVVALTASTDEPRLLAVLRAGAAGYIRKDAEPETLLAAVRAVAAGKRYIDPTVSGLLAQTALPREELSPREVEVLRQVAFGRSNKEAADVLGVSEETVKSHVSRVLAKLGAENRAQAIVQGLRRGVLSMDEI